MPIYIVTTSQTIQRRYCFEADDKNMVYTGFYDQLDNGLEPIEESSGDEEIVSHNGVEEK